MPTLLSLVLAGAAVTPAVPVNPGEWFNSKDHPKTALRVAERGHLAYSIDVAPDGSAIRCITPSQSDLDSSVCELLMKSARFTPAADDQGKPAFAVHTGISSFLMPGKNVRPDRAGHVVTIDQLPEGVTGTAAYARVAFLVGSAGGINHCVPIAGERRRSMQAVDALGPAACADLAQNYRPAVAHNGAGEAVPSVQSMFVRFELRQTP